MKFTVSVPSHETTRELVEKTFIWNGSIGDYTRLRDIAAPLKIRVELHYAPADNKHLKIFPLNNEPAFEVAKGSGFRAMVPVDAWTVTLCDPLSVADGRV